MSVNFDRRSFLRGAAVTAGSLSTPNFLVQAAQGLGGATIPAYKSWKDVYRNQWKWDRVVRATHHLNCWYQAHCSWDVYVKDGLVYREEQAAEYEQVNADLPDFNPRGCQKGGCFSNRMYDPTRITNPMRRVGPRGSGKWERVTWDEALNDIADTYLDVAVNEGTDRLVWDLGPGIDLGVSMAAQGRFGMLTQCVSLDMDGEIGDSRRGTLETFGKIVFERSADDYFNSDLILFWGGNPIYTQIPQAHFFTEAKYRGARIISVSPDYNPSATKSDLWIPIKPGTDAALAMAVCHEIVAGGHVKEAFVKEQTDMPLLVRSDTRQFLRAADIKEGGHKGHHMMWDSKTDSLAEAPYATLKLDGIDPVLNVKKTVKLKDGSKVEVRSVYSLLLDRLADYTPENASPMCGVTPKMIRRLVAEIVKSRAMSNIAQTSLCKYYHGNLAERAMAMIFALTGNIGRKGAGFSGFPVLNVDGGDKFVIPPSLREAEQTFAKLEPLIAQRIQAGDTQEMVITDLGRMLYMAGNPLIRLPIWSSGTLFWSVHGGVGELSAGKEAAWKLGNKRPMQEYVDESLQKQWQPLYPPRGSDPRIMISLVSNPLRRARGSEKLLEVLWPKLKKIVVMDWRINSTARHADYVLPVAPWYERTALKWVTPLSPYLTTTDQATPPLGDSKTDWTIIVMLSKAIQNRAKARGIKTVKSPQGLDVKFDTLYDDLTMGGQFKEGDDDKVAKAIYDMSGTHKKKTWEEVKAKGFARFEKLPEEPTSIGNMCEFPEHDTIVPLTFHVRDKVPYPTSSRRIQFFVDHPFYDELDELLPRFKEPPLMGGDYPLMMTGGKARWSIHSTWRDSPLLMRLDRPEPYMLMSLVDATKRNIKDGDWVRAFNDVGAFNVKAKVSPSLRPGQTLMYHAYEHYQFKGKGDMNSVSPTPLNPVELAGGHPHLIAGVLQGQNSVFDRDTRIEIELLPDGPKV